MKQKKTITLENWVIQSVLKKIPKARYNFSAGVEALLIVALNDPESYWKAKVKESQLKFSIAVEQLKNIQSIKNADKVIKSGIEIRNDLKI